MNNALIHGIARHVTEWSFESNQPYANPFAEVELDVLIENETGGSWRIPSYWAGGSTWRVRFAAPAEGNYRFTTSCNHIGDASLHDKRGELEIAPWDGEGALLRHGRLGISADRRHFEYEDGTPFFWLGDTWWMGLTKRLSWPDDFQRLAADRVAKGFNVVQIVAGLYPDMLWGDERGENEAGLPYDPEFNCINPQWYDAADVRIRYLVQQGLTPCIVACWGCFLLWMGEAKMKRHWRYLVARWGAGPVVWCLAGEASSPHFGSEARERDEAVLKRGWTAIGHYLRELEPMQRLITIHPFHTGRDVVEDDSVMDFEMLQTWHDDRLSIPVAAKTMREELAREPRMPVLNSETNYEGIMGGCYDDVQRNAFWISMLLGAAGHTYGANGIWQVNTRERPYGASPHGNNWGSRPWDEAMLLPGSAQVSLGKRILERYDWPRFESHPEWTSAPAGDDNPWRNYAAGIPGEVRIIYTPRPVGEHDLRVCALEPGVRYEAKFINPSTGEEHPIGSAEAGENGEWLIPPQPEMRDWLVVLEAR